MFVWAHGRAEISCAIQTAYFLSIRDHASRVARNPLRKPLRGGLLDSAQILLEGYRPQVEAHRQPCPRRPRVLVMAERRLERTLKCHAISHPISMTSARQPGARANRRVHRAIRDPALRGPEKRSRPQSHGSGTFVIPFRKRCRRGTRVPCCTTATAAMTCG